MEWQECGDSLFPGSCKCNSLIWDGWVTIDWRTWCLRGREKNTRLKIFVPLFFKLMRWGFILFGRNFNLGTNVYQATHFYSNSNLIEESHVFDRLWQVTAIIGLKAHIPRFLYCNMQQVFLIFILRDRETHSGKRKIKKRFPSVNSVLKWPQQQGLGEIGARNSVQVSRVSAMDPKSLNHHTLPLQGAH